MSWWMWVLAVVAYTTIAATSVGYLIQRGNNNCEWGDHFDCFHRLLEWAAGLLWPLVPLYFIAVGPARFGARMANSPVRKAEKQKQLEENYRKAVKLLEEEGVDMKWMK